jgi:hypothetical protein
MSEKFNLWYEQIKELTRLLTESELDKPSHLFGMTVRQAIEDDDGELATFYTSGYSPQDALDAVLCDDRGPNTKEGK